MSENTKPICSEKRYRRKYGLRSCLLPATLVEDGKPWCRMHAPSAKAKRDKAWQDRYNAQRERECAAIDEKAFGAQCAALVRAAGGTPEDVKAGRVRVTVIPCEAQP